MIGFSGGKVKSRRRKRKRMSRKGKGRGKVRRKVKGFWLLFNLKTMPSCSLYRI